MPAPSFSTPELTQLNDRGDAAMGRFRECLRLLIKLSGSQTAPSEATDAGLSTLRKYFGDQTAPPDSRAGPRRLR